MALANILRLPISVSDSSLATACRDALLTGAVNDGVRFIADLSFGYCYPGGAFEGRPSPAAPANNAVIYDVADRANGAAKVISGNTINYSGGGFDFGSITKKDNYLEIPASVAADIYTSYGGASQQFLACMYIKLPTSANWNTSSSVLPMLQFAGTGTATYQNTADLVAIAQGANGTLQGRRQTGAGAASTASITLDSGDYGLVTQIAYWRNASGVGIRIKNSNGTKITTAAVGSNNTQDFSGKTGIAGVSGGFWAVDGNNVLNGAGQTGAKNFRLYRLFVENLARSGRSPLTVLDADYARVAARSVFS